MTVNGGNAVQNSAYRSDITMALVFQKSMRAFSFVRDPSAALGISAAGLDARKPPQLMALTLERV
jgi:hypothetical protein